jgi:hypothetical protein
MVRLSKGFWNSLAAVFVWWSLPSGAYLLYVGITLQGVINLAIGLVLLIMLVEGRTTRYLENRRIYRAGAYVLLASLIVFSLLQLLSIYPQSSVRGILLYFPLVREAVLLVLVGLSTWQFTRSQIPG